MAARSVIVTSIRRFLGTAADDPAYSDAILNPIVQEACDSLVTDINIQNRSYNSTTVTLAADSTTSHLYTFATQSSPLTDFASWIELRYTDSNGFELNEVPLDGLRQSGSGHFAITGIDSAGVVETSVDSTAGKDIWMRYTRWPALLTADGSVPGGIPLRFHDVIALEALYAFELGGEARTPQRLYTRWMDRRAQLIHHVGKRGAQPSRTRLYSDDERSAF